MTSPPSARDHSGSYAAATAELAAVDPVIRRLVDKTGPVDIRTGTDSHFAALVRAIVYQQLAEHVAHILYDRLVAGLGNAVEPSAVAAMSEEAMRAAGMSRNKAVSLHDLAAKVLDGTLDLSPERLVCGGDQEVIDSLTGVRGIGIWSAQMFLIFQLGRLDVWPATDLGVRRGFGIAWERPTPSPRELEPLGDPYRPYRTVLAWYCWKADAWRDPVAE